LQTEKIVDTTVWLLPNPSGLNAHYQLKDLARLYGELKQTVDGEINIEIKKGQSS
jgi:TDG/mug DNA glycosylase family protein